MSLTARRRLRTSLATTRRQLHTAQQRLVREIEQRESLQQSVDRARFHDAFTGLPNRYYFMEQLDRILRARRDRRLCVFLIAIDRFQLINETLGHTAGDELMVQAGRRFQRAVSGLQRFGPLGRRSVRPAGAGSALGRSRAAARGRAAGGVAGAVRVAPAPSRGSRRASG